MHMHCEDKICTRNRRGSVIIQKKKNQNVLFLVWWGHLGSFCDRGIKMTVWEQGFWKQPLENMSPEGDLTRQCADSRYFPGSWRPGKIPKIITMIYTLHWEGLEHVSNPRYRIGFAPNGTMNSWRVLSMPSQSGISFTAHRGALNYRKKCRVLGHIFSD